MSHDPAIPADTLWSGFAEFYELYASRLVGYVLGMGAARPDAEDCAHDALLRVWPRRSTLVGALEEWDRYVFETARNCYRDVCRSRTDVLVAGDELPRYQIDAQAPEDAAERTDERRALGHALRTLLPRDRAVLVAVEVHGVPYPLLCRDYGVTENTLRQVRFRAAKRMAKVMTRRADAAAATTTERRPTRR